MRWERGDLTDEGRRARPRAPRAAGRRPPSGQRGERRPRPRARAADAAGESAGGGERHGRLRRARAARASCWPARWRSPTWATRTPSPSPRTRSRSGARSRTPATSTALHELPVVHLRVFMVYGPGQLDLRKLVPYVTVSLLRGEAPRLTSGARAVDWIYVDDVVDAFLRAAVAPGAGGPLARRRLGRAGDRARARRATARAGRRRRRARVRGDPGPAARARPGGGSRRRRPRRWGGVRGRRWTTGSPGPWRSTARNLERLPPL